MKCFRIIGLGFLIATSQVAIFAQPPLQKLSEKLNSALSRSLENGETDSAQRTAALGHFLNSQRQLLHARRQATPLETNELRNSGKATLIAALENDPTLAEAYTMLAELELTSSSQNVAEALAFTELAVRANPANFGGHRLRARILTRLSRLAEPNVDRGLCLKAISAWKQVVNLDPMNAEGWAFLGSLYEVTGDTELQIEALKKWTGSPVPVEAGFYRAVMGPDAELTPEGAAIALVAILIKQKRGDEAIDLLTKILIDDPDNRKAFELASVAIDTEPKGRVEHVVKRLQAALIANPGNKALTLLVEKINLSRM